MTPVGPAAIGRCPGSALSILVFSSRLTSTSSRTSRTPAMVRIERSEASSCESASILGPWGRSAIARGTAICAVPSAPVPIISSVPPEMRGIRLVTAPSRKGVGPAASASSTAVGPRRSENQRWSGTSSSSRASRK